MARIKEPRVKMPEQEPQRRINDFEEVNLGLSMELAQQEARRCLQCKKPMCMEGCPVRVNIPGFIGAVAKGDFTEAAKILKQGNALPAVCGRVCPQETQCEAKCVLGVKGEPVAIGWLERFVADWALTQETPVEEQISIEPNGKKVAIVGSGPAGLTCAGELAKLGYEVTIFEAFHEAGGVLIYGIPQFRLPKEIVKKEIDSLKKLGVKIELNVVVGKTVTLDQLIMEEGFSAIFVANGAGLPVFMNLPGENLKGVYSANEFLTRVNLMRAYRFGEYATPVIRGSKVVVIGGGNVAMDAVRTARRLGAEPAILVYRRSREEMPARIEEVHHAEEEGIVFEMLTNPVGILGNDGGWVKGIECQRQKLGEPDSSGRRRPEPIEGSNFVIDCDLVIEAIGTRANPMVTQTTPDLKVNKWGYIETDETGMTSKPGVFAGGDIVRGAATVILAMGDGKRTAAAIDAYLKK
ncbi:MAG: NADPH-dependent glutamate synthase [Phycisphaerae bacterium]|jgi:glutamate synthase (NADPH/NADH) small chain|nr:NADPH-dependent glutamate synthase [Phycisphaerae bacterium]